MKVSMPVRVAKWLENMNETGQGPFLETWIGETLGARLQGDVTRLQLHTPVDTAEKKALKEAEKLDKLELSECFNVFDVRFDDEP